MRLWYPSRGLCILDRSRARYDEREERGTAVINPIVSVALGAMLGLASVAGQRAGQIVPKSRLHRPDGFDAPAELLEQLLTPADFLENLAPLRIHEPRGCGNVRSPALSTYPLSTRYSSSPDTALSPARIQEYSWYASPRGPSIEVPRAGDEVAQHTTALRQAGRLLRVAQISPTGGEDPFGFEAVGKSFEDLLLALRRLLGPLLIESQKEEYHHSFTEFLRGNPLSPEPKPQVGLFESNGCCFRLLPSCRVAALTWQPL